MVLSPRLEEVVVKTANGSEKALGDYKGHVLDSEAYFKLNTISVLMHKDALSKSLKDKLKL